MAEAERLCHIFRWGREMKKVGNHGAVAYVI